MKLYDLRHRSKDIQEAISSQGVIKSQILTGCSICSRLMTPHSSGRIRSKTIEQFLRMRRTPGFN